MLNSKERYNIETEKIKKELETELKQIISSAKAKLVSSYTELLGDEYVELIDRRRKLGEKYKELIGIAFEYATQSGGRTLFVRFQYLPMKNTSEIKIRQRQFMAY